MDYLGSKKERDASVTAEYVKAEVLAQVSFTMPEKDPALFVTQAVAYYYSLHRNLRLDFINGKPKKAVEYPVSVIKPVTLKILTERKLEMDKSDLEKDFPDFLAYLEKTAITTLEGAHMEVPATRLLTGTERSPKGRRTRLALENSRPGSRRLASTRRSLRARSTICPTVHTQERTKIWPCCPISRRRYMPTRRGQTSKLWATTERRRTTEMARLLISPRRISDSRSRYWQTQAHTTQLYHAVMWGTQGNVASLSRSRCCRSLSC
jgi:hypothetical protein